MPQISVIVPVYKVEQYLEACLASIAAQTFRDYELILVDDGSPDRCGEMCEAYAAQHPNVMVIHQKNAGLSAARNTGAKAAAGEYISFIDSDDYIAPDCLEYLYGLITEFDADIAIGGRMRVYDSRPADPPVKKDYETAVSPEEALINLCYGSKDGREWPITAWGKLYCRDLVLRYPYPVGRLYEDIATTHKLVGASHMVAYGSRVIYYWRQREQSITHDVITEKQFDGILSAEEQLRYVERHYPGAVPAAKARCANKCVDIAYRIVIGNRDRVLFRKVRKCLSPYIGSVLRDRRLSISVRVRSFVLMLGYYPFLLFSKVFLLLTGERT